MQQTHSAQIINGRLVPKNVSQFNRSMTAMPDGEYVIFVESWYDKSLYSWMKKYRRMVDVVAKDAGEQKQDIHEMVKREILPELFENKDLLLQPAYPEISTKYLNEHGWDMLIKNFQFWVFKNYDYCI